MKALKCRKQNKVGSGRSMIKIKLNFICRHIDDPETGNKQQEVQFCRKRVSGDEKKGRGDTKS